MMEMNNVIGTCTCNVYQPGHMYYICASKLQLLETDFNEIGKGHYNYLHEQNIGGSYTVL